MALGKLSECEIAENYVSNQRLRERYFEGVLDSTDEAIHGAGGQEQLGLLAQIRKWLS